MPMPLLAAERKVCLHGRHPNVYCLLVFKEEWAQMKTSEQPPAALAVANGKTTIWGQGDQQRLV